MFAGMGSCDAYLFTHTCWCSHVDCVDFVGNEHIGPRVKSLVGAMLFSEQFCRRHAAAGYGDELRFGRQSDRMGHGIRDPSRANESPTKRIGALSAPSHLHGVNV